MSSIAIDSKRTLRQDTWWLEPMLVVLGLGAFAIYSTWAALQNGNYYAAPYLSPFYSPCLAINCEHVSVPLFGSWYNWSPAILILWIPGGFRLTCYYYRKAYYRSFFWSPPACAVKDAAGQLLGRNPLPVHPAKHPPLLLLGVAADPGFPVVGRHHRVQLRRQLRHRPGTLVLIANAALLSLYSFSCHSCRHLCGGGLNSFKATPGRFKLWGWVTKLNEKHMQIAWTSLVWVGLTDVYVRLLAHGVIQDLRII